MSDVSSILSLPLIQPSQAQKHVTHNEALQILDVLVQLTAQSMNEAAPPVVAQEGDCFLLPASPTGVWVGQGWKIACLIDSVWMFIAPRQGWRAWVGDIGVYAVFDGNTWVEYRPALLVDDFQNLAGLGVNTQSDNTNKLAVASESTLFSHAGNGHQIKVNKNAAADTGSLLFQTNWSGRAEMGLNGSDDFSVKVSADGASWAEALRVDSATAKLTLPGATWGGGSRLDIGGVMRLEPTAIADLPSAAVIGAGGLAFVPDAAGGAQLAYSDGTDWLKVRDGLAI